MRAGQLQFNMPQQHLRSYERLSSPLPLQLDTSPALLALTSSTDMELKISCRPQRHRRCQSFW